MTSNKKKSVIIIALLTLTGGAFSQTTLWVKEFPAVVNGELLKNAYSGGSANIRGSTRPRFVDIDSDGDLDLFIGKSDGTISYWKNNDVSGFEFVTLFYDSIDVGENASPVFADIDADNDYDLFIGNGDDACEGGTVVFYRNDGTRTIPIWTWITDSLAQIDACDKSYPAFADIDSDGDLDLFVGGGLGKLEFAENIGDSLNAEWSLVSENYLQISGTRFQCRPVLADIDNDNDLDIITSFAWPISDLVYYENIGSAQNAVFLGGNNYSKFEFDFEGVQNPELVDYDNDGDLDLFAEVPWGILSFYKNAGGKDSANWAIGNFHFIAEVIDETIDVGQRSWPAFADIDGDSDLDLFLAGDGSLQRFYENTGISDKGLTVGLQTWAVANYIFEELGHGPFVFSDIDNDLDQDAFIRSSVDGVRFYRNDGDINAPVWTLVAEQFDSIAVGLHGRGLAFIDIDGDDDLDAFVNGSSTGEFLFYRNDGTAETPNFGFVSNAFDSINRFHSFSFGDVDNDKDFDLLIGKREGKLDFYRNIGTPESANFINQPAFLDTVFLDTVDVGNDATVSIVDIDADGKLDLFVGEEDGGLNFWSKPFEVSVKNSEAELPTSFSLSQNFPNPFNPETTIEFYLERPQLTTLKVFSTTGQLVRLLIQDKLASGRHAINFDGRNESGQTLPSGVYFYVLESPETQLTRKMILIR